MSIQWLKELVDYDLSPQQLAERLSLSSIGIKQQTEDYLELDLTYNRGDLLSLRGVAYEVATLTDAPLRFLAQTPQDFIWVGKDLPEVEISGHIVSETPFYCVAKIEGLKVEASPKEWVKKLEVSGMRSVNNITDITNLVMLEYGQPLHAFDATKAEGIHVDRAIKGWKFTTLDGKERALDDGDLVIRNREDIIGIAGVMGGKNSEVTTSTDSIILEAAIFDPASIRRTSTRLGLRSEASKRFEHGLTKMRLLQALDAAIRMYQNLGGKLTAINLAGKFETIEKKLDLRISKANSLLGIDLDKQTITQCLEKLNFTVSALQGDTLEVMVPYFRLDINIEEDLIEEVARMYGYEKIPSQKLQGKLPERLDQSLPNFIYDLKKALADAGLTEVQTYSFYSTTVLKALGFNKSSQDTIIKVANPISSETEYMRTFIWPNLVEIIAKNMRNGYKDIAIFEIGKVYTPVKKEVPKESYRLAIALMNGSDNPIEELVAIAETIKGITLKQGGLMKELEVLFHPTRYATIKAKDAVIGGVAEVHPRFLNNFGVEKRVAILEIAIEPLNPG